MAGCPDAGDMTDETTKASALLADAIGAEPALVPLDARIGVFERWDSLAHMRLILAVEQQLGRLLDPDETIRIECLDDVVRLLNSHGRPG
jgi:acyl carrier protein